MNKALQRQSATGLALVALVFGCTVMTSGCSRTDDGSIMVERPAPTLGFGSMRERMANRWGWNREEPQEVASFPTPPPAVVTADPEEPVYQRPSQPRRAVKVVAPRFKPMRVGVKPPFQAAKDPSKPLTCNNVTQPGGRVKVSCE